MTAALLVTTGLSCVDDIGTLDAVSFQEEHDG
jgi:hypothetical protein